MPTSYPLDTTGLLASNLVTAEIHTLTEINAAPYRILIPTFAPFYLDNFNLTYENSLGEIINLIPDVDFFHCLPYLGASRSTGKMVYGGLTINNSLIEGTLRITYQTIGGDWTADSNYVRERLIERIYNPRTTVWDVVTNKPNQFPPTVHGQPSDTIYGQLELINSIDRIVAAIGDQTTAAPSNNSMSAALHPLRRDNPHEVTKTQLGLGLVENYETATQAEIDANLPVDKYILHSQALQMSGSLAYTKADVGLANVDNTSDADKPVSTDQSAAIEAARVNAIGTADADATAKANNAVALALAGAATDATSKANAADNSARAASTPVGHIGSGGNSHALVTTTTHGFMSSTDKVKLDNFNGTTVSGNAGSASILQNNRNIGTTGDATWSVSFNGSSDVYADITLSNTGIVAGSYAKPTFDTKGRAVGFASLVAADIPNLDASKLTSGVIGLNTSGNAATATKLGTSRTINGVNFDGTANIVINAVDVTNRIPSTARGAANGVASLDASGLVPANQLPSYVDDALEFADLAALPATGETGKIYVTLDTNKIYRWSGTVYIEISPTSGTADAATRLATARTINGVSFDGTANIVVNAVDSTARIASSEKGAASGVATLDGSGVLTASQIPANLKEVAEVATFSALPVSGVAARVYVTLDTNRIYRWDGITYVSIAAASKTRYMTAASLYIARG